VTPLLRPLSFSEMLDRAFALAVRTVLPIAAVIALMFGISFGGAWSILYVATRLHVPAALGLILAAIFFIALTIAGQGAALTGLVDAYFGRSVQFSRMLTGSRRTWPQLSLLSLFFFVAFGLLAGVAIALYFGAVWFAGHLPFLRSWPWSIAGIGFLVLLVCMILALDIFVYSVLYVALVGCVAEWRPALESWERGWKRSGGGGRAWRTLGYGTLIAFGGVALSLALQLTGLGVAALLPKGALLSALVTSAPVFLANFLYYIFELAWFVVYYVDLRVRTEGLDLTLESDSLEPLAAGAPAQA
jgi:hypothetical protein